ncbi:hypothetical protein CAE01nite_01510 [Cellulomonas aerilata]|uniref:Uncharacterized protein n=1 Tax=Cellulomonas aerilata TaxID=515326 RepID=A0A512D7H5_9CELL|nr:hypothetical protein CAE01nite_01510 [Cellulomonas aerilata]
MGAAGVAAAGVGGAGVAAAGGAAAGVAAAGAGGAGVGRSGEGGAMARSLPYVTTTSPPRLTASATIVETAPSASGRPPVRSRRRTST